MRDRSGLPRGRPRSSPGTRSGSRFRPGGSGFFHVRRLSGSASRGLGAARSLGSAPRPAWPSPRPACSAPRRFTGCRGAPRRPSRSRPVRPPAWPGTHSIRPAQGPALVGQEDAHLPLVGPVPGAAHVAGRLEALEQGRQGAGIEEQALADLLDRQPLLLPQHQQDEVLRVGQVVRGQQRAVGAAEGMGRGVDGKAELAVEAQGVRGFAALPPARRSVRVCRPDMIRLSFTMRDRLEPGRVSDLMQNSYCAQSSSVRRR